MGPVMLEEIERDPAVFVDGHNLTVKQRINWQAFTGAGYVRELRSEDISPTRPEYSAVSVSARQAAVAVKLDLVEPFFALGDVLNGEGIHRLDELNGAGLGCFHLGVV